MDNFKVIYRILKTLERYMDYEEFDNSLLSADTLGISENRWAQIMEMLITGGYVQGVRSVKYDGQVIPRIILIAPRITLKGLEYLEENSLMKKAGNLAKGISDIIK